MLSSLASRLEAKIAEAQAAARSWLSRTLGREPPDAGESLARSQGVQAIIGGILEAVRRKLFTPGAAPDPIETGRIGNITTPTQAIRHGLSLAGGGPAIYEDGKAAELIGNGQKVHDELAEDGFFQDGYEWKYGHPANTFEPHMRLDGKQFTSWDDPQLAVNFGDSWLRRSHYAPGDHKGCCCAFVQVIVESLPLAEMGEGGGGIFDTTGGEGNLVTDGMSPEEAAAFMASRRALVAKYPNTANRIRHWGTGEDVTSRAALRENMVMNRDYWKQVGTDPTRLRQLNDGIAMLDAGDSFDVAYTKAFQTTGRLNGLTFHHPDGTATVIVRPGIAQQTAPFKVGGTGLSATEYTTTHEFGHVLEHDLLDRLGDRTPLGKSANVDDGSWTIQDAIVRAGYNADVSNYGRSNTSEGFAELFVAYESQGFSGQRMGLLLDLVEEAETWPTFANPPDQNVMTILEWLNRLDAIGPDLPPGNIGVFKP